MRHLRAETPTDASTRATWRWSLACAVLGVLLALVLYFPAHWAASAIGRLSGERITLVNAQGTVWSGSAQLVLRGGAGSRDATTLPGRLVWRLRPGWEAAPGDALGSLALTAKLSDRADLATPWRVVATRDAEGRARIGITDLDWRGPAGMLRGLGTPWNTLSFEGALRLSTQHLQLRQSAQGWQFNGRLLIEADAVSSRISTVRPLGSYRMELDGQAGSTGLALATTQGVLQLQGEGSVVGGQLRFQGSARAEPERRAALGNVLNLIGNRSGPVALQILR